ncbi:MAG: hypothetical protein IJA57_03665 [Alistipes sp.]|nr:hypothetical protein [Alistipes sp.]
MENELKKDIVFVENTLKILNQYNEFVGELEQSYARSLFINLCVGLLVIPRSLEYEYSFLPPEVVNKKEWGICKEDISTNKDGDYSVGRIFIHLRNSVMHNRFNYDTDLMVSVPIKEITFYDKRCEKDEEYNFCATLKFEDFRYFVLKTTNIVLEKMKER